MHSGSCTDIARLSLYFRDMVIRVSMKSSRPHPNKHGCAVCGAADISAMPHTAYSVVFHTAKEQRGFLFFYPWISLPTFYLYISDEVSFRVDLYS